MQLAKFLGRKSIYYPEIDSTQNEIWRRVEQGAIENGLVISAGRQTRRKRNPRQGLVYRRRAEISRSLSISKQIAKPQR